MKLRTGSLLAVSILLALPMAGIAYLGAFTRMHADDFCIASTMQSMGFWPSIMHWYNSWAGRFMYFVASHLISTTGPAGAAVSPALLILVWWLGLAWAVTPILRKAGWFKPRLLALPLSGMVLFILLSTIPNLFQSVFWRDGQINYSFPLVGLSILGGVALRAWLEPRWPAVAYAALAFFLAFVSGGFAEIFDATQVAVLALALVIALLFAAKSNRTRLALVLGAALVGSVIAILIVVTAPGNLARQDAVSQTSSLARVIPLALRNGLAFVVKFLSLNRWWALISILGAFLGAWWLDPAPESPKIRLNLAVLWTQTWFRGLVLLPVSAVLLAVAACAPSAYALNSTPDDRGLIVPQALFITAMLFSSGLLATGLRRLNWLPSLAARPALERILPAALLLIVLALSAVSLRSTLQLAPNYQAYARSWDKREAVLLDGARQGTKEITVVGLENRFGIADLRVEPDYWVNSCMASYYGFSAVRGR
jgi:hypothetical protein